MEMSVVADKSAELFDNEAKAWTIGPYSPVWHKGSMAKAISVSCLERDDAFVCPSADLHSSTALAEAAKP
jgi:hypothetical protein